MYSRTVGYNVPCMLIGSNLFSSNPLQTHCHFFGLVNLSITEITVKNLHFDGRVSTACTSASLCLIYFMLYDHTELDFFIFLKIEYFQPHIKNLLSLAIFLVLKCVLSWVLIKGNQFPLNDICLVSLTLPSGFRSFCAFVLEEIFIIGVELNVLSTLISFF